jgi:hypothetical protein
MYSRITPCKFIWRFQEHPVSQLFLKKLFLVVVETYFPGVNYENVTNQRNNALLYHILQSIGSSSVKSTH